MTDANQLPPLPTLQPGDSHMESLIEAAIQGHADIRDAMRWLVRQLVPATQPAEVTDAQIFDVLKQVEPEAKRLPQGISKFARAILALRPVQVPMTPDEIVNARNEVQAHSIVSFAKGVYAAEAHHFGITTHTKKEAT